MDILEHFRFIIQPCQPLSPLSRAQEQPTLLKLENAIFWSAIFVCMIMMIDYKFYSRNFKNEITWEVTILKLYAKYFHDIFRYKEGRPN